MIKIDARPPGARPFAPARTGLAHGARPARSAGTRPDRAGPVRQISSPAATATFLDRHTTPARHGRTLAQYAGLHPGGRPAGSASPGKSRAPMPGPRNAASARHIVALTPACRTHLVAGCANAGSPQTRALTIPPCGSVYQAAAGSRAMPGPLGMTRELRRAPRSPDRSREAANPGSAHRVHPPDPRLTIPPCRISACQTAMPGPRNAGPRPPDPASAGSAPRRGPRPLPGRRPQDRGRHPWWRSVESSRPSEGLNFPRSAPTRRPRRSHARGRRSRS